MAEVKRGMFFAVSIMLLCISLLSMAIYLSEQSAKNKESATVFLDIDRATDAHSGMEDQIARIMSVSMNVSARNNSVTLNETLPLSGQIAEDLERFSQFEANYTDPGTSISMNLTSLKQGSLLIEPSGIAITHPANMMRMTPQDSPQSSGDVRSYDINLTFPAAGADAAAWQAFANGSGGADPLAVRVRVQDASYALILDFDAVLDKYGTSLINVTQGGALVGYVKFSPPAAVEVWYAGNIGLKASVGLNSTSYVEANDTISVLSAANRTARVRIA